MTFFSGGGGLVGTARDYLRFLTMIQNGGELGGHRILRPETVALMTTNQLPKEAFPIHFDKEVRHGTGFGFGFCVRNQKHQVGPRRPRRRIRLGRSSLDPLLGQPGRQIDRDHARTDHALSMGHRVRREKDHLRRDREVRVAIPAAFNPTRTHTRTHTQVLALKPTRTSAIESTNMNTKPSMSMSTSMSRIRTERLNLVRRNDPPIPRSCRPWN